MSATTPDTSSVPRPVTASKSWPMAAGLTLAVVLAILALHWKVVLFTVHIWETNETFTHGFLIFPISLWLIWSRRHALAHLTPKPSYGALAALVALGLGWEMGYLARVMVVQQYALVGMIIAAVWTILGTAVVRALTFPLAFLVLAVPFGDILLPYMMQFTADFTVSLLRLTGIPVFREGNFFSLPTGNWSVVEACSGLRYLIASFTLGLLYAYLTYRSLWRRTLFVVASLAVPILANGLRAYMIVMIGHLSGMRYAVGVDHLVYGWLFFGLVMLILFWIGSFWREDGKRVADTASPRPPASVFAVKPLAVAAAACLVVAAAWPLYVLGTSGHNQIGPEPSLAPPAGVEGWQGGFSSITIWRPHYLASRAQITETYSKNGQPVFLYIGYYRNQRQGEELITSDNVLAPTDDPVWVNVGEQQRYPHTHDGSLPVVETLLSSPSQRLVVWNWYWVDGRFTANPYLAKLLEAKAKLLREKDDSAVIILASPYDDTTTAANQALGDFLSGMLPGIRHTLEQAEKQ